MDIDLTSANPNQPSQPGDESGGTWWPFGGSAVPLPELTRLLALSARHHARQAVRLFVSDDWDGRDDLLQAALSAGTAVELLTKAYLATVDHALLAERGDRDSVLVLTGHSGLAGVEPWNIRTVGAAEALAIAKHLHKDLPWSQTDPTVLRIRNAAAHMGLVERSALRRGVTQMCRLTEALLTILQVDRRQYWAGEDALTVVDGLLDAAKSEVARTVAAKLAVAKRRLAELIGGLDPAAQGALLAALSGRAPRTSIEHDEPQICPVCSQQGWLVCGVDDIDVEYDVDVGHDGAMFVQRQRWATPIIFECPVCSLELSADELGEFDFPSEIQLEAEDDDAFDDYEPDEEDLRLWREAAEEEDAR